MVRILVSILVAYFVLAVFSGIMTSICSFLVITKIKDNVDVNIPMTMLCSFLNGVVSGLNPVTCVGVLYDLVFHMDVVIEEVIRNI